jgi:hypothetical protein
LHDGIYRQNKTTGQISRINGLQDDSATNLIYKNKMLYINWGGEGACSGLTIHDPAANTFVHHLGGQEESDTPCGKVEPIKGYSGYFWVDDNANIYVMVNVVKKGIQELMVLFDKSAKWKTLKLHDNVFNDVKTANSNFLLIATDDGIIKYNLKTDESEWILRGIYVDEIHRKNANEFIADTDKGFYLIKQA